jgi:LysM repeat protein
MTDNQGGQNPRQRPPLEVPAKNDPTGGQQTPTNQGGIRLGPDSIIPPPSKVNPSTPTKTDRSPPIIKNYFNFYGAVVFNCAPLDNADKISVARNTNAVLPPPIQDDFNKEEINYCDPATGDFYYAKHCSKGGRVIIQIGRSCNCYTEGVGLQLHHLMTKSASFLELLNPNENHVVPDVLDYTVWSGETVSYITARFGIPLELLIAANKQVENINTIYAGQSYIIPAQAYVVSLGDTFQATLSRAP